MARFFKDVNGNSLSENFIVNVHAFNTGSNWIIRANYNNAISFSGDVQLGTDTYATAVLAQVAIDRMLDTLNPDDYS